MKIIVAKNIGLCFGVERALKIVNNILEKSEGPFFILEPLIHNEILMEKLKKKGLKLINSLDRVRGGALIISAHGEKPIIFRKAKIKKLKIIDTTCPLVKNAQNLARKFQKNKYKVIIIGDKKHKEVEGVLGATNDKAIVINNEKEAGKIKSSKPIAVIAQTTQDFNKVKTILKELKKTCKKIEFLNTLCQACQKRQKEVENLAKKVDLLLIIGSKTSANTKRLFEIGKKNNKNTVWVENAEQLKRLVVFKRGSIGLAGGTSAPKWLVNEIIKKIK
jgi:4-hydroxy-3-methylbut-2-enyl diphosphate reductase